MKIKHGLIALSVVIGVSSLFNTATPVNAVEKVKQTNKIEVTVPSKIVKTNEPLPKVDSKKLIAKAETVSTEAQSLNQSIIDEISKVKEQRKLLDAQEELKQQQQVELLNASLKEAEAHLVAKKQEEHALLLATQGYTYYNNVLPEEFQLPQTEYTGFDIRTPSNLTGSQIDYLLRNTELYGLGNAYASAEAETGVNALVLVGISALESNWGRSNIARTKNNLFGYQAYDHNTDAAKVFATRDEGVMVVARHLAKSYLTPGGPYFNGYTLEAVNVRYASDKKWNVKITGIMEKLSKK